MHTYKVSWKAIVQINTYINIFGSGGTKETFLRKSFSGVNTSYP